MAKWTDDLTYKFVEAYLKHDCLYNCKSPNYRKKNMRDAALLRISEEVGVPGFGPKEAYAKLRSIKSTFSQESKKIRDSCRPGAGSMDVYVPHIKWYQMMDNALKTVSVEINETQDNLQRDPEQIPETTQTDSEHVANEYIVQQSERSKENQKIIIKPPRKRTIRDLDQLVTRVKNVSDKINSNSTHVTNTEFDYFGKNVASQLNNMPLALAIEAQTHIQNYLSRLRLQHINSSHNYSRPSSSHSYYFSPTPSPTSYVAASPEQMTEPNSYVVAPASPEQLTEPNSYVVAPASPEQLTEPNSYVVVQASSEQMTEPNSYVVVQASSEQMTEPNSYVVVQASSEQVTDVDPTNEDILAQACESIRYC